MKAPKIFAAAALMLASLGVSTAASAQWNGNDRHYQNRDDKYRNHDNKAGRYYGNRGYGDRRYDRRYDRGHDRRWRGGNGWRNDRRCWTEWRYHRQVRVCR